MSTKADGDYWRHECNRCRYIWYSKNESPGHCSGCNSPLWNRERVRDPGIWDPNRRKKKK